MENDDLETSEHLDDNDDVASESVKSVSVAAPAAAGPSRNKVTKKKKRQSKVCMICVNECFF